MGDLKSGMKAVKRQLRGAASASAAPRSAPNVQPLGHTRTTVVAQAPSATPRQGTVETKETPKVAATAIETKPPKHTTSAESVVMGSLVLPPPTSLMRQGEYRTPALWLARGPRTQLSEQPQGVPVDAYIGLDFGTAYTKAAVGLLDKVFPVDWDGVVATASRYVLPTEYCAFASGRSCLGQPPEACAGDLVSNLKQGFIANTIDDAAVRRAAVFLALVLQYVRAWVFERHGAKIGRRPIRWYLNVGVPCDGAELVSRRTAYDRLMRLAWSLSLQPASRINFAGASKHDNEPRDTSLPQDLVAADAIPEFVAQLAGYARSSQRRNGLHALVDVGGGTVDMVTFNVHQSDGEDVFPFFVPSVQPLGTFGLIANRLRGHDLAKLRIDKPLAEMAKAQDFSVATGLSIAQVLERDRGFLDRVHACLVQVLAATKRRRYRSAPEWRNGVRTFLAGGGSQVLAYREALCGKPPSSNIKLDWLELPSHSRLDGFDANAVDYQRLSVACGLATDAFSLGRVVPAAEVEDDNPTLHQISTQERPTHEDLYPK